MPGHKANLRRLFSQTRPYWKAMGAASVFLLASSLANLAIPWLLRYLIDAVFVRKNLSRLSILAGGLMGLFVVQALFSFAHNYLIGAVGQRVLADFRIRLFDHLQGLSLRFFSKRRTGELLSRLTNDITVLQTISTEVPVTLLRQSLMLVGGVVIIFYMNWRLTGLILLVAPVIVGTARLFGGRLRKISTRVQDRLADTTTLMEEMVSSIRMVKSFVQEGDRSARFRKQIGETLALAMRRLKISAAFGPTLVFLGFTAATLVLWYGGKEVISGIITPGEVIAFILYAVIIIGPMGSFARLISQVQEALGATERIFEILDTRPDVIDSPDAVPLPPIEGEVRFHNVGFEYEPGVPVLRRVSLIVKPGERVALVGPSGAGKSTLTHLLHRFYDPTEGWIAIDGRDLRKVTLASLYRQIGLVPQESSLLGGTIRENLLFGNPNATEAEMVSAARAAHAHAFIVGFPLGYDTEIGEKGINLSGGQRQRLAIARAFLKNPRLLILDEATAFLDNESEALVQDAVERLMRGKTTFIIAHRLSTIQRADRIFVLDKGRVVEEGTHEALLDRRGLYYHLYTLRAAGILEDPILDLDREGDRLSPTDADRGDSPSSAAGP
jgi:subfamily B ATP-binding cassette protein MsbA